MVAVHFLAASSSLRFVYAGGSIFAKGFAISDQACRRDTVVSVGSHLFPSLVVSQLPRIFVLLTGIEKPALHPGLRSSSEDEIVISGCRDAKRSLNCFPLKDSVEYSRVNVGCERLRIQRVIYRILLFPL